MYRINWDQKCFLYQADWSMDPVHCWTCAILKSRTLKTIQSQKHWKIEDERKAKSRKVKCKHKSTNIQIHKDTMTQTHKYTNTQIQARHRTAQKQCAVREFFADSVIQCVFNLSSEVYFCASIICQICLKSKSNVQCASCSSTVYSI